MKETRAESDGVANIVSLVRDDDVDVIFGSPSSRSKTLKYQYSKLSASLFNESKTYAKTRIWNNQNTNPAGK